MINIGIGVSWAKSLYSVANNIIANFRARVLSYPNSIFEAGPCLDATLEELNAVGLLDDASLIVTPNAYNEGVLYDVIPNTPLGDMDVVRATTATRVNSAGLIEVVPRNLVFYSEQFDNAAWTKANSTVTANATTAPNGTLTADRIQITSATNARVLQSGTGASLTVGKPYTFSCWIKSISGTGKVGIRSGQNGVSAIWSFTNEWVRYTFTSNAAAINEEPQLCNNTLVTGADVSPDFYAWGFQIDNGSTATEYFPTTTRLNIPRIDYTNGSCPSLLVEPQRTNLITYSQNLSDASYSSGADLGGSVTRTVNYGISPDGTQNATRLQIVRGATYAEFFKRVSTTAGSTYTLSFYAKSLSGTPNLYTAYNGTYQNPITFTNQWVRYTYTFVASAAAQNGFNLITFNGLAGTSLTADLLVWGVQLELGTYPTSYIPTVASSVTRNADVIYKTGISSLIGQTEGTLFLDFELLPNNINSSYVFALNDGTTTNMIRSEIYILSPTVSQFRTGLTTAGVGQGDNFTTITQLRNKMAISYSLNNFKIFINGTLVATDTSATIPTMNTFNIGNRTLDNIIGSSYKQAILFKTQLSNAECIALTTL